MLEADLRDKLAGEIDVALWRDLRTHAARDVVFLVDRSVALLDAAVALASDDTGRVAAWIAAGALTRPGAGQLQRWEKHLDKRFDSVIVSPYILATPALDA
ncbi:MAG: hypothetical protein CSA66_07925 [Proteobacteria bacterium]|nr:MAG: hypothetical protein CSA66_07925 [Pseudomonadota bacterium]